MCPKIRETLLVAIAALALGAAAPSSPRVTPVEVLYEQSQPGTSEITIRLKNNGSRELNFPRAFLPWRQSNLILVAVRASDSQQLTQVYDLDSAPPGIVTIPPGKYVERNVRLAGWFPDLDSVLKQSDVLLLACYRYVDPETREIRYCYGGTSLRRYHVSTANR